MGRSFAADGTVLGAIAFSNAEIFQQVNDFIEKLDGTVDETKLAGAKNHLFEVFSNVNGHDVTENDTMHPAEAIKPKIFRDGHNILETKESGAMSTDQKAPSRIFKRQNLCNGLTCKTSTNCLFLNCGPCGNLDLLWEFGVCMVRGGG